MWHPTLRADIISARGPESVRRSENPAECSRWAPWGWRYASDGHEVLAPIEVRRMTKKELERDSSCTRPNCGQRRCSQNTHGGDGTRSCVLLLASYEWKQRKDENPEAACVEVMKWVGSMMREWPHRLLPVVGGDGWDEEVMVQKRWRRWSDPFIEGNRQVRESCCWTAWSPCLFRERRT